jgi:NlpC/P60 family
MPGRVNPAILLGIVSVAVLSLGVVASAQILEGPADIVPAAEGLVDTAFPVEEQFAVGLGGTASDALGVGEAQLGKPFVMATDGPDTFSCVGLMRYILRTTGVDLDAPWVPEEYLGRYAPVDPANIQPGDIVIYPNWATMYAGDGMVLNANEFEGFVTHTPMDYAGEPLGIVRPPYL